MGKIEQDIISESSKNVKAVGKERCNYCLKQIGKGNTYTKTIRKISIQCNGSGTGDKKQSLKISTIWNCCDKCKDIAKEAHQDGYESEYGTVDFKDFKEYVKDTDKYRASRIYYNNSSVTGTKISRK